MNRRTKKNQDPGGSDSPRYFTTDELAVRWKLSPAMIRKLMKVGLVRNGEVIRLHSVRIGTARRIPRAAALAFEALLEAGEQ